MDTLSVLERHELRKDLKTFRYAVEFPAPLYGSKRVKVFVTRLKALQENLGYLNDIAGAQKLKRHGSNGLQSDAKLQQAAGYVMGWHAALAKDAWQVACQDYRRLDKTPAFWL
jgi:CHAD domain-containing protein